MRASYILSTIETNLSLTEYHQKMAANKEWKCVATGYFQRKAGYFLLIQRYKDVGTIQYAIRKFSAEATKRITDLDSFRVEDAWHTLFPKNTDITSLKIISTEDIQMDLLIEGWDIQQSEELPENLKFVLYHMMSLTLFYKCVKQKDGTSYVQFEDLHQAQSEGYLIKMKKMGFPISA